MEVVRPLLGCHAAPLQKAWIEQNIWADVEHYIHHPDEAHRLIAASLAGQAGEGATLRAQLAAKQQESDTQQAQRDTILAYYRTGHMTETDLTHQLDAIAADQAKLTGEIAALNKALLAADDTAVQLAGVDALLADLQAQYDAEPLTPKRQRTILEQLVKEMVVRTAMDEETGKRRAVVHVRYVFEQEAPVGQTSGHARSTDQRTPHPE